MSLMGNLAKLLTPQTFSSTPVATVNIPTAQSVSGNPFLAKKDSDKEIYGKNRPVPGGYFAGYHNGEPNIVGKKLFILI